MRKRCKKCGIYVEEDVRFCPNCENAVFSAPEPEVPGQVTYNANNYPGRWASQPEPKPASQPVATQPEPEPVAQPVAAQPEPKPVAKPVAVQPEPKPVAKHVAAQPEPKPAAQPVATQPEPKPAVQPVVAQPEPKSIAQPVVSQSESKPAHQPVAAQPVENMYQGGQVQTPMGQSNPNYYQNYQQMPYQGQYNQPPMGQAYYPNYQQMPYQGQYGQVQPPMGQQPTDQQSNNQPPMGQPMSQPPMGQPNYYPNYQPMPFAKGPELEPLAPGESRPKNSMGESLKQFFSKYAEFSGRSRRSDYWQVVLLNFLISLGAGIISVGTLSVLYSFAVFIPNLAVLVRRMHDIGKSGAALLICLVPLAGPIILLVWLCQDSQVEENQYGRSPKYQ